MFEHGTPEYNLVNGLTAEMVRFTNAAKQCKKVECDNKSMMETAVVRIENLIDKYTTEVKNI